MLKCAALFSSLFILISAIAKPAFAEQLHNVIYCEIYDLNKNLIRAVPGTHCLFLNDGHYLSARGASLTFYSPNNLVVWQKRIHAHHQLNGTIDGQKFLVMSSEIKHVNKKGDVRFDTFHIMNRKGDIEKTFSLYEAQNQFDPLLWQKKLNLIYKFDWDLESYPQLKWEFSHANSFYEIPPNPTAKKNSAFAAGNFIININSLDISIILDSHLKKVLWFANHPRAEFENIHDMQVLPNGHLLFFRNNNTSFLNNNPSSGGVFSSIEEFDPVKKVSAWVYKKKPQNLFFTEYCGGAQLLDNGHILFNDLTKPFSFAIEITRSGTEIWRHELYDKIGDKKVARSFQQVKRYDLTSFLKNNRGL